MQNEITKNERLLNEKGEVVNPGWSRHMNYIYDRNMIKASRFKIKEWDYYCVLNDSYGAAFTVADNGYLGFISVTIFDFTKPEEITNPVMTVFPMGAFNMPSDSNKGDVVFENKKLSLRFLKEEKGRRIKIEYLKFHGKNDLKGEIFLEQPGDMESMVIATPFAENKRAFYYNQKINCMAAKGALFLGEKELSFNPDTSFGVLDWGRGVWTYSNTWYWGSGSGRVGGELFGFNIGYGFGDTSKATENMLFYKGTAHKLENVAFHIPPDSYTRPWTFSSSDGRFEMDFVPVIDRYSNTNLLILKSMQHQVFGHFTGTAILDDGKKIELKNFFGFAEEVSNRW